MYQYFKKENSIIGPFYTLERIENGYLADNDTIIYDSVIIGYTLEETEKAPYREYDMEILREERNKRLADSDKYVLPDFWEGYTSEKKQEWIDYRQGLRDFPETVLDVKTPVWPTKPA